MEHTSEWSKQSFTDIYQKTAKLQLHQNGNSFKCTSGPLRGTRPSPHSAGGRAGLHDVGWCFVWKIISGRLLPTKLEHEREAGRCEMTCWLFNNCKNRLEFCNRGKQEIRQHNVYKALYIEACFIDWCCFCTAHGDVSQYWALSLCYGTGQRNIFAASMYPGLSISVTYDSGIWHLILSKSDL